LKMIDYHIFKISLTELAADKRISTKAVVFICTPILLVMHIFMIASVNYGIIVQYNY